MFTSSHDPEIKFTIIHWNVLHFTCKKQLPNKVQQLSSLKCNSLHSIAIKMDCTAKSIRGKGITWYNCTILNHLYRLSTVFFVGVFVFHRRSICVFGVLLFYGNLFLFALRTYRASAERLNSWMKFRNASMLNEWAFSLFSELGNFF